MYARVAFSINRRASDIDVVCCVYYLNIDSTEIRLNLIFYPNFKNILDGIASSANFGIEAMLNRLKSSFCRKNLLLHYLLAAC